MADYFFDSSGLAKRYISEIGSVWVETITAPTSGNSIFVANITGVEIVSALARRVRGGKLLATDALSAISSLERDLVAEYLLTDISFAIVTSAMSLANKHALRGYDAVQLAVAVDVNQNNLAFGLPPITFVSADNDLNNAAQAEGLTVENPNSHP
jgi:hypothetical protein